MKKMNCFFSISQLLFLAMFTACVSSVKAQVVFEDDFENYTIGEDITTKAYELKHNAAYTGTVSGTIDSVSGEKFVSCVATPNGQAIMQLRKNIQVTPGATYLFEASTMGTFKRHLSVFKQDGTTMIAQSADFAPAAGQETVWARHELSFTVPQGVNTVKLCVYHNWSGTLNIDKLKVSSVNTTGPYYLSSTEGNDSNTGAYDSPWRSLNKISSVHLLPGDTIYFKKGDRFNGHFIVNGSGSENMPIVISSYGSGEKPILSGEVGAEGGGDYQEAIYIENNDNIVLEGLEVNNERSVSRPGVDDADAYGIHIENTGSKVMKNFTVKNMTFQNVYAVKPMNDPADFNGLEVSAVRIFTAKNTVEGEEKNIRNVLVEDCYFTDLQRLGVHVKHQGGAAGIGNDSINRNMNLVFRNNEFHYTGGTCVLPTNTYNCLIENNIFDHPGSDADPRMPNRGSSVWTWHCRNTVIQYNKCISVRGYLDSHGIHVDHENYNTFVQYNYMEDCEGGFVEILGGNVNAVYRFNVSVNDGWRENPNWVNSNHTIWINEKTSGNRTLYSDSSYIYNNTIVMDSAYATSIDINAKNTFIFNNIFYVTGGANMGGKQVVINNNNNNNNTPLYMHNNLFFGNIANDFKNNDDNPVSGDPLFKAGGGGYGDNYQLKNDSPAINAGIARRGPIVPGARKGIFVDVPAYPTVDYFGNPIDLLNGTPNIGACNLKKEDLSTLDDYIDKHCVVYPNPVVSNLYLELDPAWGNDFELTVVNVNGCIVQTGHELVRGVDNDYCLKIDADISNGLYLLRLNNGKIGFSKRFLLLR